MNGYALNNSISLANPIGSRAYTNNLPLALESIANVSNIELFHLAIVSLLGQCLNAFNENMVGHIRDNLYYQSYYSFRSQQDPDSFLYGPIVILTTIWIFYLFDELMIQISFPFVAWVKAFVLDLRYKHTVLSNLEHFQITTQS